LYEMTSRIAFSPLLPGLDMCRLVPPPSLPLPPLTTLPPQKEKPTTGKKRTSINSIGSFIRSAITCPVAVFMTKAILQYACGGGLSCLYPNPGRMTRFITPPSPDRSTGSSSGRGPPRHPEPVLEWRVVVVVMEGRGWRGGRWKEEEEEEEEEEEDGMGAAAGRKAWTGVERRDRTTTAARRRWWTPRGGGGRDMGCCGCWCWCEGGGRLLLSSGPGICVI
jgi:hypothetical protein